MVIVGDDHKRTQWRTVSGKPVDIFEYVSDASARGEMVHIGTDSLQCGRVTKFVTVVAVLTEHSGGRAAYIQDTVPRITALRERLLQEVWKSVELGMELSPLIKGKLTIHIDANPDERHMSSKYVQELVGLALGMGFSAVIKPDSWCASHAADHVVRVLNVKASRRRLVAA
jgi:predicted RNase H-related nuclease YkuK (DUF458 family)